MERAFGKEILFTREGGSGPEADLADILTAPLVFVAVGLDADRIHAPNERVDLSAVDLFATVGRPVATGLKAGGSALIAPDPASAVFAGTPALLFGEASGKEAVVELTWDAGKLSLPIDKTFPLAKVAEALAMMKANQHFGKIVLTM